MPTHPPCQHTYFRDIHGSRDLHHCPVHDWPSARRPPGPCSTNTVSLGSPTASQDTPATIQGAAETNQGTAKPHSLAKPCHHRTKEPLKQFKCKKSYWRPQCRIFSFTFRLWRRRFFESPVSVSFLSATVSPPFVLVWLARATVAETATFCLVFNPGPETRLRACVATSCRT